MLIDSGPILATTEDVKTHRTCKYWDKLLSTSAGLNRNVINSTNLVQDFINQNI